MHKFQTWGICVTSVLASSFFAQASEGESKIYTNIKNHLIYPQEKLYLHIDKPYYAAGDSIWFKGYLNDAHSHLPASKSNFIYIELIDKANKIISRKKFIRNPDGFHGAFPISPNIQKGNYCIRAYTRWMINQGSDFFFYKPIQIGNSIFEDIISDVKYTTDSNGDTKATIIFTNKKGEPLSDVLVNCSSQTGKKIISDINTTDQKGEITIRTNKYGKDGSQPASIIFGLDPDQYDYTYTIYPQNQTDSIDIQFFAEGGHLIPNITQQIAYKAIGKDGYSREFSAIIQDSKKEQVASISTQHAGMGSFAFTPEEGETYHALINTPDKELIIPLPPVEKDQIALSIKRYRNQIICNADGITSAPQSQQYKMVILSRGKALSVIDFSAEEPNCIFDSKELPEGVLQFLLVNSENIPISERLLFIQNNESSLASATNIASDQATYKTYSPITLSLSSIPNADLSVSVTDNRFIRIDSLANSIHTEMLLNSDLKGYIENPGYYFYADDSKREIKLDLLMQTQGWKRYDNAKLLKGENPSHSYAHEESQQIFGRVVDVIAKPQADIPVWLASFSPVISEEFITTKEGRFMFNNMFFPDSIQFTLRVPKERRLSIQVSEDELPQINNVPMVMPSKTIEFDEYLDQFKNKYFNEGGERLIALKEVVVTANRKPFKRGTTAKNSLYKETMDQESLLRFNVSNLYELLVCLPNITFKRFESEEDKSSAELTNNLGWYYRGGRAMLQIDDAFFFDEDCREQKITPQDIESIEFLFDYEAQRILPAFTPYTNVINVQLNQKGRQKFLYPSSAKISPLGFAHICEFYSPKYEPNKLHDPDFRSTIYWQPVVKTDSSGKATLTFYSSASSGTYTVQLEGTDNNGNFINKRAKIEITD